MKYMTFCGGINGDCAASLKDFDLNIFVDFLVKSGTPVLNIRCIVPKG
jgi:hypothetical protein